MPHSSIATALLLLVQIHTGSAQTCPSTFEGSENYLIASSAGTCDSATCSCQNGNCCGSCFSISDANTLLQEKGLPYVANCWAYTCGDMCQDTPCEACRDHFTPLPIDDTGSRPSDGGECPASRPHKTTDGCCGACKDWKNDVFVYVCGGVPAMTRPGLDARTPPGRRRRRPPRPQPPLRRRRQCRSLRRRRRHRHRRCRRRRHRRPCCLPRRCRPARLTRSCLPRRSLWC